MFDVRRPVTRSSKPHLASLAAFGLAALASMLLAPPLGAARTVYRDNPEPGLQGETLAGEANVLARPYTKGVRLIGHTKIEGGMGAVMAWSGNCAYAPTARDSGRPGVTVIDVSDPSTPRTVGLLTARGALGAGETLHAVETPNRKILVASVYGVSGPKMGGPGQDTTPGDAWLAVYDVAECASPRLLLEYAWPERVHTLRVSPNGKRVYGTVISPFTGEGGIQVLDVTEFDNPRFLGKFGATRQDGTTYEFAPHEVSISPDEHRVYAGVISSTGKDLNRGIDIFPPNREGLGPDAGGIYIFDNSDLAEGRPDPKMRLIGTAQHGGWHSAIQANIGGKPYLVGAGELGVCPASWPRITDISDERNPRIAGHFRLAMNRKPNCPPESKELARSLNGPPGTAASHWNDVDSSSDTHLGLFPMIWAGLRIADLRDPTDPKEVAYFKPGDQCMTHVRYRAESGHIWFGCAESGFYVIELRSELRKSLGLTEVN